MDIQVGDRVQMKKAHPCGSNVFQVLRVGLDFKLRCEQCGRDIMAPRIKIAKHIKKVLKREEDNA